MFYALFDVSLNKKEKKKQSFTGRHTALVFLSSYFRPFFLQKIVSHFLNISNNFNVKKILQFSMQLKSEEN